MAAETLSTSVGAPEKIDNLLIAAITYKRPVYIECYKEVWGEPCPKPPNKALQPLRVRERAARARERRRHRLGADHRGEEPDDLRRRRGAASRTVRTCCSRSSTPAASSTPPPRSARPCWTRAARSSSAPIRTPPRSRACAISSTKADCFLTFGTIITDDYLCVHRKQIRRHGAGHHGADPRRLFHLSRASP